MWVIKEAITKQFFGGWDLDDPKEPMITADSKIYAAHFSTWDTAAMEIKKLIGNWKPIPKDEA